MAESRLKITAGVVVQLLLVVVVIPLLPLRLGSWWGFVPVGLLLAVLVLHTALEDRTLQAELPGYRAYAQRVRRRLLPGVW